MFRCHKRTKLNQSIGKYIYGPCDDTVNKTDTQLNRYEDNCEIFRDFKFIDDDDSIKEEHFYYEIE